MQLLWDKWSFKLFFRRSAAGWNGRCGERWSLQSKAKHKFTSRLTGLPLFAKSADCDLRTIYHTHHLHPPIFLCVFYWLIWLCYSFVSRLLRVVDFLTRAHVTGVENGQVNFAHTGCSRQTPALHVHFARPIWLALEGVARGVCQFIGQNKVWEGDGWVWGEGKPSPPLLWKKCGPSHNSPTLLSPWTSHCSPLWEVPDRDLHSFRFWREALKAFQVPVTQFIL